MITHILYLFTGLIVLNNPLIALGYFVDKTADFTPKEQRKTARLVSVSAFICMVVAGVIGTPLLKVLGISIPAFQIAGGILVFVIAMNLMGGDDDPVKPKLNPAARKTVHFCRSADGYADYRRSGRVFHCDYLQQPCGKLAGRIGIVDCRLYGGGCLLFVVVWFCSVEQVAW